MMISTPQKMSKKRSRIGLFLLANEPFHLAVRLVAPLQQRLALGLSVSQRQQPVGQRGMCPVGGSQMFFDRGIALERVAVMAAKPLEVGRGCRGVDLAGE